ncbi:Zinc finger BED domain-containing protein 5 [Thelohanellus kitauei]|uniref:Zinc finger BED domain-containing protein 5 n=1 Tax=Thelohanellus kitauei TaxID=669202 RepID=A0A0C2J5C1_THEKT|nr:Zinc finger BED domain-containing protein 5 [Thelohanellus kitauei]
MLIHHTDARWLTLVKVLCHFYELRKGMLDICLPGHQNDFVEVLSYKTRLTKLASLADIFRELNFSNNSMRSRIENIMTSTDKINAFHKNLTNWKKHAASRNVEILSSIVERNYQDILPLILNHLNTLLAGLNKYFPSIFIDQ